MLFIYTVSQCYYVLALFETVVWSKSCFLWLIVELLNLDCMEEPKNARSCSCTDVSSSMSHSHDYQVVLIAAV